MDQKICHKMKKGAFPLRKAPCVPLKEWLVVRDNNPILPGLKDLTIKRKFNLFL